MHIAGFVEGVMEGEAMFQVVRRMTFAEFKIIAQ